MADGIKVDFDMSRIDAGLTALAGPVRESLARRMLVAGGQEMRDEAKRWVPTSVGPYNPKSRGSQDAGTLRDAIYLAYDRRNSTELAFTYNISWNNTQAWWGKLVEFGYTQRYVTIYNKKLGVFQSLAKGRHGNGVLRDTPKRIPGKPFIRPAYEITITKTLSIMAATGRVELPILLREHAQ
jgi:hypothetical protein